MVYYGIPNSPTKSKIAKRTPVKTIQVQPYDLAWDCQRHIAFLDAIQLDPSDDSMLTTTYADYLRKTERTTEAVIAKCQKFWQLFQSLLKTPPESWATVTDFGARLDGSHRAACAVVIGHQLVPVSVVPTYPFDMGFKAKCEKIRLQKEAEHGS